LQVAQDGNVAAEGFCCLAHTARSGAVLIRVPMREIEPQNIRASGDQCLQHARHVGRGA
jgi:hypothetical protein